MKIDMIPLFLVFLILKLTGVINWSWWWVTSPLWLPFAFMGIMVIIVAILATIVAILESF